MKKDKLTFGAKINCTFAALAAVLALSVWSGFHAVGSLSDSLDSASGKTLRKVELAGILNTAESDMAVGQRGAVMFTYAKDSGESTAAGHQRPELEAKRRVYIAESHPAAKCASLLRRGYTLMQVG